MRYIITVIILLASTASWSQVDLSYYLPENTKYNQSVPSPASFLGYQVGDWHVTHDQIVFYMKALAATSDRVSIQEYARTHEARPLVMLTITSPENHQNIESIRKQHVQLTDPSADIDLNQTKLVHWMGYSVHGNEASGANSALLMAYYLAAAQDEWLEKALDDIILLFDPVFNPDGLNRFATWVNAHKSKNLVSDPQAREFDETWPGGRTNHYWFDLNRDWMPVQHPESKGRIALFHHWKPNILTDHHEMGSYSTFFFQPGVPSRKSPMTPWSNVDMTKKIAQYHATALDSIGSLYFSEENYDDFYIGKGSTYPDLNGSIGILFEQASSRGHVQENQFGKITFPFAIRNHLVTSFSTLKAAYQLKDQLLEHQQKFYQEASQLAAADPVKAYVFGSEKDPMKSYHLVDLIRQHDIAIYPVKKETVKNGKSFLNNAYAVPLDQPQYRLIKAMFETRTIFEDSLFYDVSSWTLPLAYNLNFESLNSKDYIQSNLGDQITDADWPTGNLSGLSDYAYIFEPYGYYAHRAINRLQKQGIKVELAHNAHVTENQRFASGSLIVPLGIQKDKQQIIENTLSVIAREDGIDVYGLNTGRSIAGSDLGSRKIEVLEKPEIALLVGEGVDYTEAGEVWHLLDQKMDVPVTLLPCESLNKADLSRYNKLIVVDGSDRMINESGVEKIKTWVNKGGVLITWKQGGKWLADRGISNAEYIENPKDTSSYRRYEDVSLNQGAQVVGGAIFEARIDNSHPLCYGFEEEVMPLFRDHSLMFKKAKNPYANPIHYSKNPLISGYISKQNLSLLPNTPAVIVSRVGKGRVINFADNPNFRAFWYGTNKLFMNALFFGQSISAATAEE